MLKYIWMYFFLAHNIWAKPLRSHAEVTPHVLILTPQAQLRLESLVPGAPTIQHLTPFTSYLAPHEETIIYVPASAAAVVQNTQSRQFNPELFNCNALSTGGEQVLALAQNTFNTASEFITNQQVFSPEDASNNILEAIIGQIGSGQPAEPSTGSQSETEQKLQQQQQQQQQLQSQDRKKTQQLEQQQKDKPLLSATDIKIPTIIFADKTKTPSIIPALAPAPIIPSIKLYDNEPRHHYVVAPVAQHIVDIVPNTVFLSPTVTNTIKARRSITNENKDANPLTTIILPTVARPEALPLNNDLVKAEHLNKDKQEEVFKRFLEADALKDDSTLENTDNLLDKDQQKETLKKSQQIPIKRGN